MIENNIFFKKCGLIKTKSFELNLNEAQFITQFREHVALDKGYVGFSSPLRKFTGKLQRDSFLLYKTPRFFLGHNHAAIGGTFVESNGKLAIDAILFFPFWIFMSYYSAIFVFVIISISLLLASRDQGFMPGGFFGLITIGGGIYWFLLFRKNVDAIGRELEKEFLNWV